MAIEGPLRELGIHDVFQLLDLSRKTGRLKVSSALRDNEGTVCFRDGRVSSASIRSNPHPLGAVLLRAGKITDADLTRARAAQQTVGESRRLGELLVAHGVINRRDVERYVRQQIEAVVFELLSWQEGFFSFVEVSRDEAGDEGIAVTTEALLMEGARRIDEWARLQQRVPHLGIIPSLADADDDHAPALELLPNEWEVLVSVDNVRDVRTIATALGRSDFDVAKVVFGLVTTGVIVWREPARDLAPVTAQGQVGTHLIDAQDALGADRLDDALSHAALAVTVAPANADARMMLARTLLRLGRDVEGEEELRLALEADPRHANALMEVARIAARRGELGRATALWQRVLIASPDTPLAEQARRAIDHASRLAAVLEAVDA